jgi:hypothetical protein
MKNKFGKLKLNKKNISYLILTLSLLSFSFLSSFSANATPDSSLYFNPSTATVNEGESFSLDAMINPGENSVSAVELHVTFDPVKFRLDSLSNNAIAFPQVLQVATIDNTNGTASIIVGVASGSPPAYVTSPQAVATFSFEALSAVSDSSIGIAQSSQAAALGELADVVTARTSATVTVTALNVVAPTFTVNEGVDVGPVSSDTINVTVADEVGLDENSLEYGFSADAVCDASDIFGNNFSSGVDFVISTETTDYLCVKATNTSLNTNYLLVGKLNIDRTAPFGYGISIDQDVINASNENALSFTFLGAEVGATYNYSIDDEDGGTDAVSGTGTILTVTDQITGIDVSSLADGVLTISVFLTDVASNQGASEIDTVSKDATLPTVSIFSISEASNSLNVPILQFTGEDNVSVARYALTESAIQPGLDDEIWVVSAPGQYVFASPGEKTLYAWVRDAAGNISAGLSDNVNIVLPTYTISGTVTGLSGSLVLRNNGSDDVTLAEDGEFSFFSSLRSGEAYNVTVLVNPSGQNCSVENGSGTVNDANVDDVYVTCVDVAPPVPSPAPSTGSGDSKKESGSEKKPKLKLYDIKYSSLSEGELEIEWKTNNRAKETLRYGEDKNLKEKKSSDRKSNSHKVSLQNLKPGAKYYFRIYSEDNYGQSVRSKIYSIVLPDNKEEETNLNVESQQNDSSTVVQDVPLEKEENNDESNDERGEVLSGEYFEKQDREIGDLKENVEEKLPAFSGEEKKTSFRWWNPFTWFGWLSFLWS